MKHHRTFALANDIYRREVNRSGCNGSFELWSNLVVLRVGEDVGEEGIVGSVVLRFLDRETVYEIELFLELRRYST